MKKIFFMFVIVLFVMGCVSVSKTVETEPDVQDVAPPVQPEPKEDPIPVEPETQPNSEKVITVLDIKVTENYLAETKEYLAQFGEIATDFRTRLTKIDGEVTARNIENKITKFDEAIAKLQKSADGGAMIKVTTGLPYGNQQEMFENGLIAINLQVKALLESFELAESLE